jgi:hypothetical protein
MEWIDARIRITDPDPDFYLSRIPGSKRHTGSRIRTRKTGQYLSLQSLLSERVLILAILVAGILIKIFIKIPWKKSGYHVQKKGHRTLAEEIMFKVLLVTVYIVLIVVLYPGLFECFLNHTVLFKGHKPKIFFLLITGTWLPT